MKRYYVFGSYTTRKEALHAAAVLRKSKNMRARVQKNTRTKKWDTLYTRID